MKGKIKLSRPAERTYKRIGGPPGVLRHYRDADTDVSTTMGCGIAEFEDTDLDWHVTYDEYLYCLEGRLDIHEGDAVHVMRSGDAIWIPAGTWVRYECEGLVRVVAAVYPNTAGGRSSG